MELWLIRHGQTADNHLRILAGHQPGKLSELGVSQAVKLGKRLCKTKSTEIYCSDLGRAKETLENVFISFPAKDRPPVTYSGLLREKGAGTLEGQPLGVWKENADKAGLGIRQYKPEGGESWEDVYKRCEKFLDSLVEKYIHGDSKQVASSGEIDKDGMGSVAKEEGQSDKFEEKKVGEMAVNGQQMKAVGVKASAGKPQGKEDLSKAKLPKILIVAHGGLIMEFYNLVNYRRINQKPVFLNDTRNCSISVVKVQGAVGAKGKEEAVYELGVKNDVAHL